MQSWAVPVGSVTQPNGINWSDQRAGERELRGSARRSVNRAETNRLGESTWQVRSTSAVGYDLGDHTALGGTMKHLTFGVKP
jgi:hypothetical protein